MLKKLIPENLKNQSVKQTLLETVQVIELVITQSELLMQVENQKTES